MSNLGRMLVQIEHGIHTLSRFSGWISSSVLVVMVVIVGIDVVGRKFGEPLRGSIDLGEIMLVVIAFTAIAYTQFRKGHVQVELVISRVSPKLRSVFEIITTMLSTGIFSLMAYAMIDRTVGVLTSGTPVQVTASMEIPLWPFFIVIAIGCILLCAELLIDMVHAISRFTEREL